MIAITFVKADWKESTPDDLRGSCLNDVDSIRNDVLKGLAHLYHITGRGVDIWAVTRVEKTVDGGELVVCCVGGKGMESAGHSLKQVAKKNGLTSIRYHVRKPAIQRLYEMYGFAGEEVERVYRVFLKGSAL